MADSFWFARLNLDQPNGWESYTLAALLPVVVGMVCFPLAEFTDSANIVMMFLLEVFLCALWLGKGPALMAAFASVLLFDFLFVPPRYALLTNSVEHIVTLVVMLLVALLTGQMAGKLLEQNHALYVSEEQTRSLYRMARELAGAANPEQVDAIAARYPASPGAGSLLEIARERLHFAHMVEAQHLQVESERLRNSILSSLSHDLRSPLTALVGLTETLQMQEKSLSPSQQEAVEAVHEQSVRLANMVSKLLDLARLSAGKFPVRKEWQSLLDVTGAALDLLEPALTRHSVNVHIPADFPLLEFDAVLIERVIGNLLENAAKYTPAGTSIGILAQLEGSHAKVCICDDGPGLPEKILTSGTSRLEGLGLTICETILKVHGGSLILERRPSRGACACFTLPLGNPPNIDNEPEERFVL